MQLVAALAGEDLIDELRLMVFPTVLGAGKQCFGSTSAPRPLKLTRSFQAGETIVLIYERAGDQETPRDT
jgi:riboflavin biosynthesis pyrimidine reductase